MSRLPLVSLVLLLAVNCGSSHGGGGTGGVAAANGEGGAPGQGGAGGLGGTPAEGGAPDAAETCDQIAAEYASAIPAALGCDVGAAAQCQTKIILSLTCGCQTIVNDASALDAIQAHWKDLGCVLQQAGCPTGCPVITTASCVPSEAGTGACVRAEDL